MRIAIVVNHVFLSFMEETKKMILYFHSKGIDADVYNAGDFLPYKRHPRDRLEKYDLVIFFSPFQRIEVVHSRYLPLDKTICYYVVEGIAKHIDVHRELLRRQRIVSPSKFSAQCIEETGFRVEKVIPHIADPNPLVDHAYGIFWRKKYPRDKKIIVYTGNSVRRKGLIELKQAVEILSRKRNDFIVVLHTDNMPRLNGYDVRILRHPNIVLELEYGKLHRYQVLAKIKYADFYVHPARSEGFGLPVLEAMQLGTPVIAIDAFGVNEIANERNSFLVPSNGVEYCDYPDRPRTLITFKMVKYDPRDLASKIDEALDASRDEIEDKIAHGYMAAKEFTDTYKEFIRYIDRIAS